jgi:catechol 2,3-dioxygenase-like lactoylglutathione lyase family enzyme
MPDQIHHELRPARPCWTHIALKVKDIDATIAWYERHTHLSLLQKGEDENGRNAWIGDATQAKSPFLLVVGQFYEGKDPFAPAAHPPLGPFAHIGIELPTKQAVDDKAAAGKAEGCLAFGPMQMPKQIGYICFLKDPDGNTIEFSFDQGVYEKAREVWGAKEAVA